VPVLLLGTERTGWSAPRAIRRAPPAAQCRAAMFEDAAHEMLRESDPVRLEALARIDASSTSTPRMTPRADIAIVGAGMAGASLAAELAPHASVLLLEAEEQPGYHSTGRSAAFWSESYGGPLVQPLTTASGPFLREPPRIS
jgi:hypothetical protein